MVDQVELTEVAGIEDNLVCLWNVVHCVEVGLVEVRVYAANGFREMEVDIKLVWSGTNMPMIVVLFAGSIFMLYMAKIPKKGAVSILGILAGILLFITGMFWMMSAFFILLGFIADYIISSGDFKSFRRNLTAYCILALAPMGAYIPMVIMPAQFDKFMQRKGNFSSFAGVIKSISFNWWAIPAMILGTIICGAIGGFIGKKLLRKHFEKAGIM